MHFCNQKLTRSRLSVVENDLYFCNYKLTRSWILVGNVDFDKLVDGEENCDRHILELNGLVDDCGLGSAGIQCVGVTLADGRNMNKLVVVTSANPTCLQVSTTLNAAVGAFETDTSVQTVSCAAGGKLVGGTGTDRDTECAAVADVLSDVVRARDRGEFVACALTTPTTTPTTSPTTTTQPRRQRGLLQPTGTPQLSWRRILHYTVQMNCSIMQTTIKSSKNTNVDYVC